VYTDPILLDWTPLAVVAMLACQIVAIQLTALKMAMPSALKALELGALVLGRWCPPRRLWGLMASLISLAKVAWPVFHVLPVQHGLEMTPRGVETPAAWAA
jgi:hypothetical protein